MSFYASGLAETLTYQKEVLQTKKNYKVFMNFNTKMLHFYFKNYSVIKSKASSRKYY